MEHCTFHKGKRKLLDTESLPGRKSAAFLADFDAKCSKLMGQVDNEINRIYECTVYEVATYTKAFWTTSKQTPGIPVAVVQCETMDGYDFEKGLVEALKIKPICITLSQPLTLYDLQEMLLKAGEQKYVMLKHIECFMESRQYLDGLISVLTDPMWKTKIVLVITMCADLDNIFTCFSQESFWKMAIFCFQFPTPPYALQAICEVVAMKPDAFLVCDGTLFNTLRSKFLRDSHSVCEVKRILKLTLLHKMLRGTDFGAAAAANDRNDETDILLASYETFLHILLDLTAGFPCRAENIYDLHSWIQLHPTFFVDKNGPFATWKSVWATWTVEEMTEALIKLWHPIRRIGGYLCSETQKLLLDLRNVEHRKNMLQKESQEHNCETGSANKRVSLHELQQRMRDKIAQKKRLDVVSQDRQRFIKLISQIMAKVLQCFDNIPDLADKLLEGNDDLLKLVSPSVASVLEKALLQPVLHPQHLVGTQLDACIAYRSVLDLALKHKNISMRSWLAKFQEYMAKLEDVDPVLRFFRSVGELEFMGMVKAASIRNTSTINVIYVPYSITY